MARLKGTVAWFSNPKGYGFLSRENEEDIFFHYTAIQTDGYKTVDQGDPVEDDVEPGPKGKDQAVNVTPLK